MNWPCMGGGAEGRGATDKTRALKLRHSLERRQSPCRVTPRSPRMSCPRDSALSLAGVVVAGVFYEIRVSAYYGGQVFTLRADLNAPSAQGKVLPSPLRRSIPNA